METPIRYMALPAQMRVTALAKGAQVMFHPQPLHLLPGLGIIDEALQKLRPSWLAAGLLLNAGSALAKGGQVMFCPQPLHQLPKLPCEAERSQGARKRRTSNVSPSTITSAP